MTITHLHLKLLSSLNYLNPPSFSPCSKSSCGASKLCQSSHLTFQLTSGLIETPKKSLGCFLFLKYGKRTPFLSFGQPSRPPGFSFPSKVAQDPAGPPGDRRPAQPLSLANPSARGEPHARSPSPSRAPSRRERAALTLLPIHFSPSSRSLPHPAPTPCPRGPAPPRRPCSSFAAMASPPPSLAAPLQLLPR